MSGWLSIEEDAISCSVLYCYDNMSYGIRLMSFVQKCKNYVFKSVLGKHASIDIIQKGQGIGEVMSQA